MSEIRDPERELALEPRDVNIAPLPRIAVQIFCLTSGLREIAEAAASDRRMARTQLRIQMGGVNAAIEAYRNAPTPNLILVEFGRDEIESLPYALDELSQHCDTDTRVVLAGPINDVELYREAIRRGVSDYLVVPLSPINFIAALAELFRPKGAQRAGRCVAFIPAKGGCGSSTLAHNVAWLTGERLSMPAILVDADLPFGTAALNFNQDPINGLAEVLFSQEKADSNILERSLSKITDSLSLLSASSSIERMLDPSPSAFDDVIDILRLTTPMTIIDLPHQWPSWIQRIAATCDDLVIVAEPELASLRSAKQIIDHATRMRSHDRPVALVINKVGVPKRPEIPVEEFLKPFPSCTSFVMPFDSFLFGTAANNGQMIFEAGVSAPIEKTLLDLARFVTGRSQSNAIKTRKPISDLLNRFVAFRR